MPTAPPKEPPPAPTFLVNETQAARAYQLTPRCLQAWRANGGGPRFVRVSKRCVRYRISDLEEWAADRLRTSTSDEGPAR